MFIHRNDDASFSVYPQDEEDSQFLDCLYYAYLAYSRATAEQAIPSRCIQDCSDGSTHLLCYVDCPDQLDPKECAHACHHARGHRASSLLKDLRALSSSY